VNGSPTVGTAPATRRDYGPYQLADYLGAYGGQVLRARTFGLLLPAKPLRRACLVGRAGGGYPVPLAGDRRGGGMRWRSGAEGARLA
jgi:hypothetical protein